MANERIIYRFRYEQPFHLRKRVPYLERELQLLKEVRYGNNLRSYQVVGHFTVREKLELEKIMGGLPQKVRDGQSDAVGLTISELLDQINNYET